MWKILWVVTVLPLFPFNNPAAAEDVTEQRSKRAQKVIATLKTLGIAHPRIHRLVTEVESHVEKDGFFYIADHRTEEGRLALRFACRGAPQIRQLQLAYTPRDSHYAVTATTRGIMLRYHYEFK